MLRGKGWTHKESVILCIANLLDNLLLFGRPESRFQTLSIEKPGIESASMSIVL
jgi:hypothetical protein